MHMTRLFGQTLRAASTDVEVISHQLLLRAGYIRPLATGLFSNLPLAQRALQRIEAILRDEINAIGGQEICMPVVHPADLWKETGRWYQIGSEMARFHDKNGHDMVLAMTHEEVVADLVRREIRSYRQLPALVYQIQTKFRDDPRPRGGLVRVREFTMLDSYSLDATWEGLEAIYQAHYQAYFNIFRRCGLPVRSVKSDTGMMGGKIAHEYMYLTPIGEDTILYCSKCDYSANRQVARFIKPPAAAEDPQPLKKVATPHTSTIDDLAALLNVTTGRTAKAVFFTATLAQGEQTTQRLIFVVMRGDMEANEAKLTNALSANDLGAVTDLRPATEDEIRRAGAIPGYASPINLRPSPGTPPAFVIADDAIPASPNLVAGANHEGHHYLNTNYGRDYTANAVTDLASAGEGCLCPECQSPLAASRAVEVGNTFQLGTRYSEALGCTFLDASGQSQPVIMGSYGIGVGRLLACIAEEHHDDKGLIWPASVAPYPVHLVVLSGKTGTPDAAARDLEQQLISARLEPLVDDRPESPGVKFNDADLMGMPIRLTISERSLKQGGVEYKERAGGEVTVIPLEQIIAHISDRLKVL